MELLEFPRYSHTFFGREIARYLNGEFGELMEVHPKLTSILYAGDRHETRELIRDLARTRDIVVCDRYTPSNQAHHAAKLPSEEWPEFFAWVEGLEYDVLQVPRPDVVVFLDLDAEYAADLIARKPQRSYTTRKADIHEIDTKYQANVGEAYRILATNHPDWIRISCTEYGTLRTPEEIHEIVWEQLTARCEC